MKAASVGRRYGADIALVQYEIPFFNMRVEKISAGSAPNTVNLAENLGRGMTDRIKDFSLLDAVGDTGSAQVLMSSHDQNVEPLTYDATTELVAIHDQAG